MYLWVNSSSSGTRERKPARQSRACDTASICDEPALRLLEDFASTMSRRNPPPAHANVVIDISAKVLVRGWLAKTGKVQ